MCGEEAGATDVNDVRHKLLMEINTLKESLRHAFAELPQLRSQEERERHFEYIQRLAGNLLELLDQLVAIND